MSLFHGKRSPACDAGGVKCRGANTSESTLTNKSSDSLSDFLLALTLGSAFVGAECAKREEIDDSNTATV